jgi:hypothetical protein
MKRKFYGPIFLLMALRKANRAPTQIASEESLLDDKDAKMVFESFVNKLCLACSSAKGGDTITSITVLYSNNNKDSVVYKFASNKRSSPQLEATAEHIRGLLARLAHQPVTPKQKFEVREALLIDILRFNRLRIKTYLVQLQKERSKCLERCKDIHNDSKMTIQ